MREIKFRAWDKIMGEMIYDGCLHNGEEMMLNIDGGMQFSGNSYKAGDFILMQCTGLKDKNGKEIYEGDILHCHGGEEHQGYREFSETGSVEFIPGAFQFTYQSTSGKVYCDFGHLDKEEVELIGNIHEHPHLLKGDEAHAQTA